MNTIYAHSHCVPCMKWTHVNKFGEVDPNIAINTLIAHFAHAANLFLDTHLPLDDVLRDYILGADCVFFHVHCASFIFSLKTTTDIWIGAQVARVMTPRTWALGKACLHRSVGSLGEYVHYRIPVSLGRNYMEGLRIEDLEDRLLPEHISNIFVPVIFCWGSFKVGFCWGD